MANDRAVEGSHALKLLLDAKRVAAVDAKRARVHALRTESRIEDALIDTGVLSEVELLRFLANAYGTKFVTTARLAMSSVAAQAIWKVPVDLAERLGCCPLLLKNEPGGATLVVVAVEVTPNLAPELRFATGVKKVMPYVGRPAGVRAAIRKHYHSQPQSFALLVSETDISELRRRKSRDVPIPSATGTGHFTIDAGDLKQRLSAQALSEVKISSVDTPATTAKKTPTPKPSGETPAAFSIRPKDYLETLNILVAMLERDREELRGHSAHVARLTRQVCEKIGVAEDEKTAILAAAYLHDIGKVSSYHLTPLNVARFEGHQLQAQKSYLAPMRYFGSVKHDPRTSGALNHLYERYNGSGFPKQLAGQDIPLGARILAITETYADLTAHEKNPYRRALSANEACVVIEQLQGTLFDPNIGELFRNIILGQNLRHRLLRDRQVIQIIDPDAEHTSILEMRLLENGFEVVISRSSEEALAAFEQSPAHLIIAEYDLPNVNGVDLTQELLDRDQGLPILMLSRREDSDTIAACFEAGVQDFLVKPASAEVVAAKATQLLSRRKREHSTSVSGSIGEVSLADVVQILTSGDRSGRLHVESPWGAGHIDIADGAIVDAAYAEETGEEAVYMLLLLESGTFALAQAVTTDRVIHVDTDTLLLEAMRRMDEGMPL